MSFYLIKEREKQRLRRLLPLKELGLIITGKQWFPLTKSNNSKRWDRITSTPWISFSPRKLCFLVYLLINFGLWTDAEAKGNILNGSLGRPRVHPSNSFHVDGWEFLGNVGIDDAMLSYGSWYFGLVQTSWMLIINFWVKSLVDILWNISRIANIMLANMSTYVYVKYKYTRIYRYLHLFLRCMKPNARLFSYEKICLHLHGTGRNKRTIA